MDAGIIVSSLIEKMKNTESTTVQTLIGKQLHLLKEFLIKNNQLFLQDHPTSEQKMTELLQAVYSAEDCIDTGLTRKSKSLRRKLNEQRLRLLDSIDYLMDDNNRSKELLECSEELRKEGEELLKESEELLKEGEELGEELLKERDELLKEREELQRRRVDNYRKRFWNREERKSVYIQFGRQEMRTKEYLKEGERLQKERERLQKKRERLQKEREKRLQKERERLQKERERLQPSMRLRPFFSTNEMKELEIDLQALCCQTENEGSVGFSIQTNFENYRAWERIADFCLKEETDVVGVEQQIEELVARLIPKPDDDDRGQSTQVIGVVGEGGSGKTTLAKSVYNRPDVKQHFTQRAWVHASNVSKARDVFMDILNQIHPDGFFLEAVMSDEEVMAKLTEVLKTARHLIVVDDIEAFQVSQSLQAALCSSSSHDSRVIITTRKKSFLLSEATHSALRVRRLNPENAWKLFSKKALSESEDESKVIEFKEQIQNILSGGLSLQVVVLGSLLSTNEGNHDKWSKVIERAITNFRGDVLALSYQDLPAQVKSCFLYLMLFPIAFEIPVRRLIHLWCAEGFTTSFDSHYQNIDPEDVAEMYFEELVIRNLIQVTKWRYGGCPKSCRIPRVVYDAFCQKASDLGFVYNPQNSSHTSNQIVVRRLSLYLNDIKSSSNHPHHLRHVRSYVAFDSQIRGPGTVGIEFFLNSSISNRSFRLLKVLDLEGVHKPEIGYYFVEKLLLLRYLGLRSTFIEYLPHSVWKLPDLKTLDLKRTHLTNFLRGIPSFAAQRLEHLYCDRIFRQFPRKLFRLKNMRTLWGLTINEYDPFLMESLKKLTFLRKLKLKFRSLSASAPYGEKIYEWASGLTTLQSLNLKLANLDDKLSGFEFRDMKSLYRLNDLYLRGRLVPRSYAELKNFFPPNLRRLTLLLSGITDDPMGILGELPELNILRLFADSYAGKKIECKSGEFPKLQVLKLWKLQAVECWKIEKEAMPCLREIELRSCTKLTSIQGLENVTTLKDITLTNMPSESRSLRHHTNTSIKINQWSNSPY
ncbi:probable disease resistance RPP8-like protein 2 [Mangifera indica]|uniref:probable disease resistance RPP8-like protein 2 n=1 Tax=Mangifera indica TaxID=29780 RepID=UPI001CF9D2A5|nr:probable disease resistance RPP8-like protein 2 [Mangifera indica]